jgi:hypothetical protein
VLSELNRDPETVEKVLKDNGANVSDVASFTNSLWAWKPISSKGYLRSFILQTLGLFFGFALFNADGLVAHALGLLSIVGTAIIFNIAVARRCVAKGHSRWMFPIIYVPIFGWIFFFTWDEVDNGC